MRGTATYFTWCETMISGAGESVSAKAAINAYLVPAVRPRCGGTYGVITQTLSAGLPTAGLTISFVWSTSERILPSEGVKCERPARLLSVPDFEETMSQNSTNASQPRHNARTRNC